MIDVISKLKALAFLLAVVVVWVFYLVATPFGWYQLILVAHCLVGNVLVKVWRVIVIRLNWPRGLTYWPHVYLHRLRAYTHTVWVSNDQHINALFGGREDHTLSGRIGERALNGDQAGAFAQMVVDGFFRITTGVRDHCFLSIEWDEVRA